MTVSVADVERWRPGDVREVFHAFRDWGEATNEARDGIATLPGFDDWGGDTADAARGTREALRRDLDAHGEQVLSVARAARVAAEGMERVVRRLDELQYQAWNTRLVIDPVSSQVLFGPELDTAERQAAAEPVRQSLAVKVAALLAEAAKVDNELASAIAMATGAAPIPAAAPVAVEDLPANPEQLAQTWGELTTTEKDAIYRQDPYIGNRAGMPFVDRDRYNRANLTEHLIPAAEAEAARLQQQVDGALTDEQLSGLQTRLDAARRRLDGLRNVEEVLTRTDGGSRLLGMIDDRGHAAVSIGDPDHASHTATFVPGTGQDLARLDVSDDKAIAMQRAALFADPRLDPDDVAVTTWMGYDRPMDLAQAAFTDPARHGGPALDAFVDGMHASHVGTTPAIDTVVGHSYGSTLLGGAALDGHRLAADNVIAVGSPGMLADRASDLALDPGARVYAMTAENDIISAATGLTLGPDPTGSAFGATELAADAGPRGDRLNLLPLLGPPGVWLDMYLDGRSVEAHGSYWNSQSNPAMLNLGAVIAGMTPPLIVGR